MLQGETLRRRKARMIGETGRQRAALDRRRPVDPRRTADAELETLDRLARKIGERQDIGQLLAVLCRRPGGFETELGAGHDSHFEVLSERGYAEFSAEFQRMEAVMLGGQSPRACVSSPSRLMTS
jgi:hypothetical protein